MSTFKRENSGNARGRYGWYLAGVFVLMHLIFLIHNIYSPQAFLQGDRAGRRVEKTEYLFHGHNSNYPFKNLNFSHNEGSSFMDRLVEIGAPGDYLIQGVLYEYGGRLLVISMQILLSALSVFAVYRLASLLGLTQKFAFLGAAVYSCLPNTLLQAHVWTSESLYSPLLAIAIYLIASAFEKGFKSYHYVAGLTVMGVGIFVRFELILYPIIMAIIVAWHDKRSWIRRVLAIAVACLWLPVSWMSIVYIKSGELDAGASQPLGYALYETAKRMASANNLPFDSGQYVKRPPPYPGRLMSVQEFIQFASEHPMIYIRNELTDAINLFLNPGFYWLGARYFRIYEAADHSSYWREVRDREGLLGLGREIVAWGAKFYVPMAIFSLLWGGVVLISLVGIFVLVHSEKVCLATKLLLLTYLGYSSSVAFIASATRWTYRSHFEFVIVVLFALGAEFLWERAKNERLRTLMQKN
jgi:hypothetical protein